MTDAPAFVLLNAGLLHRIGPHRLSVELARALARMGIPSLRFDFSGIGDSGPRTDQLPARQAVVEETLEAMDLLESRIGTRRFVIAGLCSGADAALRAAARDERVAGVVLMDGPPYRTRRFYLRHYLRRMLRPASWTNLLSGRHPLWTRIRRAGHSAERPAKRALWPVPADRDIPPLHEARQIFQALVGRRTEICLVYTGGYTDFVNHAGQFGEMFPGLDRRRVMVKRLADTDHVFTLGSHRARLIELIQSWCAASGWLSPMPAGSRHPVSR